jgi:DNA-binding response OmpR family regulator
MSKSERLRVLFVEDDPEIAQMYKLKLELDEYEVAVAPDGEKALEMASSSPFDLIFLDIRLPGLDGLAVLEKLRSQKQTHWTPVVILSNYSEPELVERGMKLGALEYLIKSQTSPAGVARKIPGWAGVRAES